MDLDFFKGKKTYIMTIAIICYALGGMVAGFIEFGVGIPLILGALGLGGLRAALPKEEEIVVPPSPGSMQEWLSFYISLSNNSLCFIQNKLH